MAFVLLELRAHPNARCAGLRRPGRHGAGCRRHRSRDIAGCLSKATVRGTGWADLKRRLDAALAAATPA